MGQFWIEMLLQTWNFGKVLTVENSQLTEHFIRSDSEETSTVPGWWNPTVEKDDQQDSGEPDVDLFEKSVNLYTFVFCFWRSFF